MAKYEPLSVPASVEAGDVLIGAAFTLGNPCYRAGRTEVTRDTDGAFVVRAYDRIISPRGGVCAMSEARLQHDFRIQPDSAGIYRVRLWAVDAAKMRSSLDRPEAFVAERSFVVFEATGSPSLAGVKRPL